MSKRANAELVLRRTRGLADAERALAKAKRRGASPAILSQAQQRVAVAAERLAGAKGVAASTMVHPVTVRKALPRTAPPSPPPASPIRTQSQFARDLTSDPDQGTRTVWVLRTGTSFHRRDCQVISARSGAQQVPVALARSRGLARCMHCVPDVR